MRIYIHIPFCESKCRYCRFSSFAGLDHLKVQFYVDYISQQISQSQYKTGDTIRSIYFGGGTPSVLSPKQISKIFSALRETFIFDDNIEISLESTPQNLTKENISCYEKNGINRISMGIQTLEKQTLKEIGRRSNDEIFEALENVENFSGTVSVDFIIGLPYVKKGQIIEDIEYILEKYSFIQHMSVYMLEDYYEVSGLDDEKKALENLTYPTDWKAKGIEEEEYLEEYIAVKKNLFSQGFQQYEISNFAKDGAECEHNKGYWNHDNMLAFGLGAHGFLDDIRYHYPDDFQTYYTGKKYEEALQAQDIIFEKVMFYLRTSGIPADFLEKNKEKFDDEKIQLLLKEKYLTAGVLPFSKCGAGKKGGIVRVTDRGALLLDTIICEILY